MKLANNTALFVYIILF